jgi:dimethylhistidine N-methyltransferase
MSDAAAHVANGGDVGTNKNVGINSKTKNTSQRVQQESASDRVHNVFFKNRHDENQNDIETLIHGLQASQKSIDPKYFYDSYGSSLFEKITELPEYYPTRTERGILTRNADKIAAYCGEACVLIEPGSGSCEKVRLLLSAIKPAAYVPMDIAGEFLQQAAERLGEEYPWLPIYALCADFNQYDEMPLTIPPGKRVVFYPGSTLGNMTTDKALLFLKHLHRWLGEDGGVIIGVDLHKSTTTLNAAYNDSQGLTAEFNLNALNHINGLANADFKTDHFRHHAFYNEQAMRIEMHLVSEKDHSVELNGTAIDFRCNETIHTENSYKYSVSSFNTLAEKAGFTIKQSWLDDDALFSVHYLEVK